MSGILDRGSWVFGALTVIATAAALQFAWGVQISSRIEGVVPPPEPVLSDNNHPAPVLPRYDDVEYEASPSFSPPHLSTLETISVLLLSTVSPGFLSTVLGLAFLLVPLMILAMSLLEPIGSFGVVLRRDYGALLACTLMSWTAAHLPFAIAALALAKVNIAVVGSLVFWAAGSLAFGVLLVCALRTVFGASYRRSIVAVCVAPVSVPLEMMIAASGAVWLIASPCILFLVYSFLRGNIGDVGVSFRHRQSFRHNLEVCTINPRDAEAHYQLGLIYQQRRQYTEAIARFRQAVEIDPNEVDAHFQLGCIAREQGRLQEALDHFNAVIVREDKHAQNDVWREIGSTYEAASMWVDASNALERFLERRPYDAEGLYRMSAVQKNLNDPERSREMLERCIEAVRTMPYYRRGVARKWGKLAEKALGESPASTTAQA